MTVDNRTANLNLPLPDPGNDLYEDVLRIIAAFQLIDAEVSTKVATQADIASAVAALVDSSPGALNTLSELAAALGNDANFASTLTALLALKANQSDTTTALALKQNVLVPGSSIKNINGSSILGSGNLNVGVLTYTYASRATLRSQTPAAGEQAIVDGLGLFVFAPASTEPDDDESCFATATGCWLLQAAHWDLVDAWQLPEVEERDAYDEDEPLRFAASFAAKVITGSATCAITSVANVASASFTGAVTGAAIGDRVIATPPAELGATSAETGRLSYHAWVSAADTVTVVLANASAAAANTNAAIRAAWPITVIKP